MGTKAFSDKGGNGDEDPNPREDAKSARLLDRGKPLETAGRKARGLTARRPEQWKQSKVRGIPLTPFRRDGVNRTYGSPAAGLLCIRYFQQRRDE